ncbi:MAG: hypothetical protein ABJA87_03055 [bacterium]
MGVVATPHGHAAIREALRLARVAPGDDDLVGGHAVQQVVDGRAVECARGSGDDDHARVLSGIDEIVLTVSKVTPDTVRALSLKT